VSGTDSAGRPWAGRSFEASPWAADDGSAPPAFLAASEAFHAGSVGPEAVVEALRDARLLVPLLAGLAEAGEGHGGRRTDKQAELALVTVAGPDGRNVLPAFSSAAAMQRWNPAARPVPAPARQVALAAAADGTELVIVDPASPTQFGLRRPALEALARDLPWLPAASDPAVARALRAAAAGEDAVTTLRVTSDDPTATLEGAEVRVVVVLHSSVDRAALSALLGRLQERWRADPVVQARVDSLAVRVEAALC
jgi:hypothetical protein